MTQINIETTVCRNDANLMSNEVGNELVIMDIESGNYIGLNATGYAIWKLMEQPVKVKELITKLTSLYKAPQEDCTADTLEYLRSMADQNLILLS